MLPADQCFGANHGPSPHVDLRLVVQHEFGRLQGLADAFQAFALCLDGGVVDDVEQVVAVFSGLLGLVHRLVSVADEQLRLGAVLWVDRHAHAGSDLQHDVAHTHRGRRGLEHAFEQRLAIAGVLEVDQYRDELVATDPGQRIAFAQGAFHALAQSDQEAVTRDVPVPVVDGLEAVQIEEDHADRPLAPLALHNGLLEAVCQQHTVGQAREQVVMCNMLQLVLVLLHQCDVGEQGDMVDGAAKRVADGADGGHFRVDFTVLALVPDLPIPMVLLAQRMRDGQIELCGMAPGTEHAVVATKRLLARVTGDPGKGLVDLHDVAIGIGDHDPLAGMREHAGGELQLDVGRRLLDGQCSQARLIVDQLQVRRGRYTGLPVVNRKRAQDRALR